jgi:hypothetical protein
MDPVRRDRFYAAVELAAALLLLAWAFALAVR